MRYLTLILMAGILLLVGCQGESQDQATSETTDGQVELEDDLSEVFDDTMDQAAEAQAGIEQMLNSDPAELTDAAVGKVWERAHDLSDQARLRAEQAIEAAQNGGGEAWEDARYAAEQARDRANLAWDQALEFSGETWAEVRARTDEARERAEEAWQQLSEIEVSESDDGTGGSGG